MSEEEVPKIIYNADAEKAREFELKYSNEGNETSRVRQRIQQMCKNKDEEKKKEELDRLKQRYGNEKDEIIDKIYKSECEGKGGPITGGKKKKRKTKKNKKKKSRKTKSKK